MAHDAREPSGSSRILAWSLSVTARCGIRYQQAPAPSRAPAGRGVNEGAAAGRRTPPQAAATSSRAPPGPAGWRALVTEALLQAGGAEIGAPPPVLDRLGGFPQQVSAGPAFVLLVPVHLRVRRQQGSTDRRRATPNRAGSGRCPACRPRACVRSRRSAAPFPTGAATEPVRAAGRRRAPARTRSSPPPSRLRRLRDPAGPHSRA